LKTEDLIYKLISNLQPVKRILPVSVTFVGWILFSLFSISLYVWSRSENFKFIHTPEYFHELLPIILSIFTSAFMAIYLSVPGNRMRKFFHYLPILFLLIWFFSLIIRQFTVLTADSEVLYKYHDCTKDFLFMNIPSAVVLIYIINKRIPILKHWIGFWILTASAAASVVGVAFLCPNEAPSHLLVIHFLPMIAISLSGILIGAFLFREV
jgi:hypothetical protein